ncbi:MAG: glycosyltransferase family 39 protein [Anaerolineae bacterium]
MATETVAELADGGADGDAECVAVAVRPSSTGARSLSWMSDRRVLLALLVLALIHGALYVFLIPPWQHPDEPGHFEHARLIAEEHRLPGIVYVSYDTRREIAISMLEYDFWVIEGKGRIAPSLDDQTLAEGPPIGIPALSQPRLYYILGAIWLQPWLPFSVEAQLYALRLLSVLMNLGVIALLWRGAKLLFPAEPYMPLAVCGLVLFEPMFTDMMASVNSDVLANLLGAAYFVAVAELFRKGIRWRPGAVVVAALALGLITKTTFVAVAATLPFLALLYPWRRRWVRVGVWVLAAIGVALVGGFIWLSLQGAGGLVGQLVGRAQRYFRVYWVDSLRSLFGIDRQGPPLGDTVSAVFRSYWAYFGWRSLAMPDAYYYFPLALTSAAVAGLVARAIRWLRGVRADGWRIRYAAFGFASVVVIWAMTILRSQIVQGLTTYSHGRYAFVGMAPFALLMMWGILGLIPAKWRPWVAVGLAAAMAVFDGACVGRVAAALTAA